MSDEKAAVEEVLQVGNDGMQVGVRVEGVETVPAEEDKIAIPLTSDDLQLLFAYARDFARAERFEHSDWSEIWLRRLEGLWALATGRSDLYALPDTPEDKQARMGWAEMWPLFHRLMRMARRPPGVELWYPSPVALSIVRDGDNLWLQLLEAGMTTMYMDMNRCWKFAETASLMSSRGISEEELKKAVQSKPEIKKLVDDLMKDMQRRAYRGEKQKD